MQRNMGGFQTSIQKLSVSLWLCVRIGPADHLEFKNQPDPKHGVLQGFIGVNFENGASCAFSCSHAFRM